MTRASLLALLERLQWSSEDQGGNSVCPDCGMHAPWKNRYNSGGGVHTDDCEVSKAVVELRADCALDLPDNHDVMVERAQELVDEMAATHWPDMAGWTVRLEPPSKKGGRG